MPYAASGLISREDILAHAYAQCRSNKGAPGNTQMLGSMQYQVS